MSNYKFKRIFCPNICTSNHAAVETAVDELDQNGTKIESNNCVNFLISSIMTHPKYNNNNNTSNVGENNAWLFASGFKETLTSFKLNFVDLMISGKTAVVMLSNRCSK